MVFMHANNSVRNRIELHFCALLSPYQSPWTKLQHCGDASSFLTLTGLSCQAFALLSDDWFHPHSNIHACSPIIGSLCPAIILLTSAFHEQFHCLTRWQLSLGRVSLTWAKSAQENSPTLDTPYLYSQLITILWRFIKHCGIIGMS